MVEKAKTFFELFSFLWEQKLWWLIPALFIILLVGILILVLGYSPIAPLFYPLF